MKIRTDFVTNSSSSSFVLEIYIDLEKGKSLLFEANGGTPESGIIDYFWSDATVKVSPKQLGSAQSVEELIQLLTGGVYDGWEPGSEKVFESGNTKRKQDPTRFIAMIREYVRSMDDIQRITITGNEDGRGWGDGPYYYRTFSYSPKTGDYVCLIEGYEFEKDGNSGGNLFFSDDYEAKETTYIAYGRNAITVKEYIREKAKEEKKKLQEAIASGTLVVEMGEAGTAGVLSQQYAREVSATPAQIMIQGKNFVHTSCSDEKKIDRFVAAHGGIVRSSTVQATDYLIIGNDIDHKTTKISRALELNANGKSIIALTESEFWSLAQQPAKSDSGVCDHKPSEPLRIVIYDIFPEFTKKNFETFVLSHGMIYKPTLSNQVDYVLVNNDSSYQRLVDEFSSKLVYLPEFLAVIGLSQSEFDAEIAQIVKASNDEKAQRANAAQQEKERVASLGTSGVTITEVTQIPENAYADDMTLKSVRIGGQVRYIGKNAFSGCANLTELILEDGIVEIGEGAFRKCVALEGVEIPPTVKALREYAFAGCKKLRKITFHEGLEYIENYAIHESPRLEEIILPNTIKEVHTWFRDCGIKRAIFPEGLKDIALFGEKLKLTYLKIPATTEKLIIGMGISKKPVEIEYAGKMLDFFKIEIRNGARKWFLYDGLATNCTIKCADGILDFSSDRIVLPEGLTEVSKLLDRLECKELILPSTLRIIGEHAFSLKHVQEITIPEGVTELANFSLVLYSLKKIYLPHSLKKINPYTLSCCDELSEIHFNGTKSQWAKIPRSQRDKRWDGDLPPYTIFCTDGTIEGNR